MGPINYSLQGIQTPFQSLAGGFQMGSQMAQAQAMRQEAEARAAQQQAALLQQQAAAEQQRMLSEQVMALHNNPNPKFEDYQRLALMMPKDQAERVMNWYGTRSKEQQANLLAFNAQVLSAAESNTPEVAVNLLRERATAERNKGNEADAKGFDLQAGLIAQDTKMARIIMAPIIARLPGGKEVLEGVAKALEVSRSERMAPFTERKEAAEAAIKEAEAKFAPDRFGAELNLTREQIEAAKAARRASDAAAAKSGADAAAARAQAAQLSSGIIPVDKRPEAEGKFRKEYNDQTQVFREVRSAFDRVNASQDNAVGDLSLIFGYMKMLDPGSVVREGEFATAQNAAGVPDRVMNLYNRILSGERLNKDQREAFKGQAAGLMTAAQKQEQIVRAGIERMATGYGLNTKNIFYEPAGPSSPGSPAIPGAPVRPGQVPSRTQYSGMSNDEILRRLTGQ
jgi:hypothetical protein